MRRFFLAMKAARELGLGQVMNYASYQVGLRSGYYRLATRASKKSRPGLAVNSPFRRPDRSRLAGLLRKEREGYNTDLEAELIAEADEITAGSFRMFGGPPVLLDLKPPDASKHWTAYEGRPSTWGVEDLKYIWEPARFGWAYPLGRAYLLTDNEAYPAAFWRNFEMFQEANPPYQGPNWLSAQEAALRILAMLFAICAFEPSPESTPERTAELARAVELHARRIPPTLSYARAQNNNHLVSEALGLYAAGSALQGHPLSRRWQRIGWKWLNRALQNQIAPDGTYSQHSMNYHRLMLHAALQAQLFGQAFPKATQERLAAAAAWLLAQVDPLSGKAPNLGSNDGACILPMASGGISDYRPVAQAAARAFLGQPAFPTGPYDETSLWLGQDLQPGGLLPPLPHSPAVLRIGTPQNWATLRCVRFRSRPSQADQLHVDLWWKGENIALDAGTFRYTAPEPWDNSLARTLVHNTIELNNQDQMKRAGRFLWLDWAQAQLLNTSAFPGEVIGAQHDGYLPLGVIHRRILKHNEPGNWQITDYLLPPEEEVLATANRRTVSFHLHWLLPDWPWKLEKNSIILSHPSGGSVKLSLAAAPDTNTFATIGKPCLVRAGNLLIGNETVPPMLGWHSPTYGQKLPALSYFLRGRASLPLTINSDWVLEE